MESPQCRSDEQKGSNTPNNENASCNSATQKTIENQPGTTNQKNESDKGIIQTSTRVTNESAETGDRNDNQAVSFSQEASGISNRNDSQAVPPQETITAPGANDETAANETENKETNVAQGASQTANENTVETAKSGDLNNNQAAPRQESNTAPELNNETAATETENNETTIDKKTCKQERIADSKQVPRGQSQLANNERTCKSEQQNGTNQQFGNAPNIKNERLRNITNEISTSINSFEENNSSVTENTNEKDLKNCLKMFKAKVKKLKITHLTNEEMEQEIDETGKLVDKIYDEYCDETVKREYYKRVLNFFKRHRSKDFEAVRGEINVLNETLKDASDDEVSQTIIDILQPLTERLAAERTFEIFMKKEHDQYKERTMESLANINKRINALKILIDEFSGTKESKLYLDHNNTLQKITKSVDEIDARREVEIRKEKRALIKETDRLDEELHKNLTKK